MVRAGLLALAVIAASLGPAQAASGAEIPPSGTLDLRSFADLRLTGDQRGDRLGAAVAAAGDVNGDGVDDMIVGAPRHDVGGKQNAGAAWVVFGTGKARSGRAGIGPEGFRIDGAAAFDTAGAAVAGAGDVNGDGFDDVLVGAPLADAGPAKDAGAAYLVLGRAGTAPVDVAAAALVVRGAGRNDRLGTSLAALPDANGDRRGDFVVGVPRADRADAPVEGDQAYVSEPPIPKNAGAALVVFTPDLAGAPVALDAASLGAQGYRILGSRGRAGSSVAALPDWNGDGRAEIAVGAPLYRRKTSTGGRAYVVWGRGTGGDVDLAALGPEGILLDGSGKQRAGGAVASVGDLGGDARGDLAVGAEYAGSAAGRVQIVYARSAAARLELSELGAGGLRIDGEDPGDHAGVAIGAAGDVDRDGRDDLLVGAHGADPFQRADAGAAYVIYGGAAEPELDLAFVGTRGFRIAGDEDGERLGRALAPVGDLTGDGRTDLALGSPRADAQAGAATLLYGPRPPVVDPVEELPPDPGAAEEVAQDGCRAVTKLGVIVDDSGSMEEFDPGRLRVAALELLLDKERNAGERLGAVEFGDAAEQLFPPVLLGSETFDRDRRMLGRLIDERVRADAGSTNYNAAFKGAQAIDPDAEAVVFITDGGHNVGRFRARHRGGPPAFVIGVGIGREGREGGRLQHIADETDGAYFPDVDATSLQAVLNRIDAGLNCDIDIATDRDRVEDHEAPAPVGEHLDPGAHSADVVVSWDDPLDDVALRSLTVRRGGKRIARFGAGSLVRATDEERVPQRNGVHVDGTLAQTYLSLRVTGVQGGQIRLRFSKADLHGDARERVTTQITESRRRR